jgi:hypothetical protein
MEEICVDTKCDMDWNISMEGDSSPEFNMTRMEWVPMGERDKAHVLSQYGEDEGYNECTQWLVYRVGPIGEPDDDSVVIIPCNPARFSPCDTPFIEVYDGDKFDELVSQLRADECYITE